MTELVQTIKRVALEAVEAGAPMELVFGTVAKTDPLEVRLHQRLTLTRRHLLFLQGLGIPAEGDTWALLCLSGGQQFLVLGKVQQAKLP